MRCRFANGKSRPVSTKKRRTRRFFLILTVPTLTAYRYRQCLTLCPAIHDPAVICLVLNMIVLTHLNHAIEWSVPMIKNRSLDLSCGESTISYFLAYKSSVNKLDVDIVLCTKRNNSCFLSATHGTDLPKVNPGRTNRTCVEGTEIGGTDLIIGQHDFDVCIAAESNNFAFQTTLHHFLLSNVFLLVLHPSLGL